MKCLIISPGKAHDHNTDALIAEYEKRLSSTMPLEWSFPGVGTKESEATAILKLLKPEDYVVLFDERGKDVSSEGLAELLDTRLQQGTKRIVFIIGGAFGVSDEVGQRANQTLRLSALVFPHMLVRLIVAEQLYRAVSIREGGKYHHA